MITVDGAGLSHALLKHLDRLAARRGQHPDLLGRVGLV